MEDTAPKISGFSILRNGVQFQYPFLEAYESLLPLVDELVINVGLGDDETLQILREWKNLNHLDQVILFESDWQLDLPENKKGGQVLSKQTNLALDRCSHDWCFYLQADEVLHEEDYPPIVHNFTRHSAHPSVEGFLFDYVHFYGSFDVIQATRSAYRREVRLIRKSAGARSVGDAQSFRKQDGSKLSVLPSGGRVFHYGWVRPPEAMKVKTFHFDQLYHGKPRAEDLETQTPHTRDNYRYKRIWGLHPFRGTHPRVMGPRVKSQNWKWDYRALPLEFHGSDFKKVISDFFEMLTGYRAFEYRSYRYAKKS